MFVHASGIKILPSVPAKKCLKQISSVQQPDEVREGRELRQIVGGVLVLQSVSLHRFNDSISTKHFWFFLLDGDEAWVGPILYN